MRKKIALLHRHPENRIKETNAAFPYLKEKGMDIITFKKFDRLSKREKFFKDILWMFYAPLRVMFKGYDVIYCDDSIPFYPALVKLVSPKSKVVIRIGDFHLMYYFSRPLWLFKFLHFFEVLTWKMVDEIIAISDRMALFISTKTSKRVYVVLDPVDPKDFPITGIKNQGTVMFHGTLTVNKNVQILLNAAYAMPHINFYIIGDGEDRERLEDYAPENVFFKGWVPFKSISKYLESCAVGVALRSDNPGNDYVVTSPFLQYGIMGKPCLVTRRKVFGDYKWQFSTVEEFIEKLEDALTSPDDCEERRKYFIEKHGAEKIAEEIWEILTSV